MTSHEPRRPSLPRIAPVENPSAEVIEAYARSIAGPDGAPLNIFATLAHNPKLLKRFTHYAGWFLNKGLLPPTGTPPTNTGRSSTGFGNQTVTEGNQTARTWRT